VAGQTESSPGSVFAVTACFMGRGSGSGIGSDGFLMAVAGEGGGRAACYMHIWRGVQMCYMHTWDTQPPHFNGISLGSGLPTFGTTAGSLVGTASAATTARAHAA
jgi:hypothetical protein